MLFGLPGPNLAHAEINAKTPIDFSGLWIGIPPFLTSPPFYGSLTVCCTHGATGSMFCPCPSLPVPSPTHMSCKECPDSLQQHLGPSSSHLQQQPNQIHTEPSGAWTCQEGKDGGEEMQNSRGQSSSPLSDGRPRSLPTTSVLIASTAGLYPTPTPRVRLIALRYAVLVTKTILEE